MGSQESVEGAVKNVLERFRRIDILVNNAGVHCVGPVVEIPMSEVETAFNTNVYGIISTHLVFFFFFFSFKLMISVFFW